MKILDLNTLELKGVYSIRNTANNKQYIGSTTMSFIKRLQHHVNRLRNNKHKNSHLQNAWNKYTEDDFEFEVLEVCEKENCLIREQYYIDYYNDNSYNINKQASGTPNMSKEVIEKRRQTMLRKYKNGELDHVKKLLSERISWNKGLKMENTDHLKVPKTITDSVLITRKNNSERNRNNSPNVYVYDLENNFLGMWRSSKDIEEDSLKDDFILSNKIISRFKGGRYGFPYYYLETKYINMCLNNKKQNHKNLQFKIAPLDSNIQRELGEFRETPEVDNPELSL